MDKDPHFCRAGQQARYLQTGQNPMKLAPTSSTATLSPFSSLLGPHSDVLPQTIHSVSCKSNPNPRTKPSFHNYIPILQFKLYYCSSTSAIAIQTLLGIHTATLWPTHSFLPSTVTALGVHFFFARALPAPFFEATAFSSDPFAAAAASSPGLLRRMVPVETVTNSSSLSLSPRLNKMGIRNWS